MDIKEFKYAWRYTSENYALFSPKQLSEMNVVKKTKQLKFGIVYAIMKYFKKVHMFK